MQLRIALHYDAAAAPAGGSLGDWVGHVRDAERHGFDVAWVGENALDAPSGLPAALPMCAAFAAATDRIRIGSAVLPLPLHHPVRVAEDAATLDALAAGRFELGVGLGADRGGFQGFGVALPDRVARFEEAVALIGLAWREGPVQFRGSHYQLDGIEVLPKPASPIPLWIGGASEEAQQRAARLGAGLWWRASSPPGAYLDAWRAAGRPAGEARIALLAGVSEADLEAGGTALATMAGRVGQVDLVLSAHAFASDRLGSALRALRALGV